MHFPNLPHHVKRSRSAAPFSSRRGTMSRARELVGGGMKDIAYWTEPGRFMWATGIEDTFITDPWPKTGRTLDEYELTGHYQHWRQDLLLMRQTGVKVARYGIPWHLVQPEPERWDWSWADRSLDFMLDLGIE